jgi:hypothetical protein
VLVIGGLQGAAELVGLSLTDPTGILVRTFGSLALEAVLYIASNAYLTTRSSLDSPRGALRSVGAREGVDLRRTLGFMDREG